MRHAQLIAAAVLAAITVAATPALSLDRPARPDSVPVVTRIADLDRPFTRQPRARRADSYWHWRYRAAYTRWLHNEYVRSGYPVRHHRGHTYVRVDHCCCCAEGRRW